jgi:general secretion pathway protein K
MTGSPRPSAGARPQRGSVLVAVLVLVGLLALVTAVALRSLMAGANAGAAFVEGVRAEELGRSGIEFLVGRMANGLEPAAAGTGAFSLGPAEVSLRYRDESARIDLNLAPRELLAGLFGALGADPRTAAESAEIIVRWRDAGQAPSAPAAGPARFASTAEVTTLPGLPPALIASALPWLTVANGTGKINLLLAEPTVLLALPGMTPQLAARIVETRTRFPDTLEPLLGWLGAAKALVGSETAGRLHLLIRVGLGRSLVRRYDAVIQAGGAEERSRPYRVVSWQRLERDD